MWYPDLSPCTYFPVDTPLVAVGWLEQGKPFTTGPTNRTVIDALTKMCKHPLNSFQHRGYHVCDLCQSPSEARGHAGLFIPHVQKIYASPELIVHYINAHHYAPPEEFCQAVLACPPMRSLEHLQALKAAGGTKLIHRS